MSGLGELMSVQTPLVQAIAGTGWQQVPGRLLDRTDDDPFITSEVAAALVRLNPQIAEDESRVEPVLRQVKMLPLLAANEGLVETNLAMSRWLRGLVVVDHEGIHGSDPVRLIDFDNLDNNSFIVSEEVRYGTPGAAARFDAVLWVNGLPLVVGELKTPLVKGLSWMTGATELVDVYQPKWPAFFAANAFVFASDGKQFRYAGVGAPVGRWMPWGSADDQGAPRLQRVLDAASSMLAPRVVLDMLRDFTLFERPDDADHGAGLHKIVARYPQYEAVNLIVERAKHPTRRRALIYHTQGSGKTLAMVFAAGKLLRDPALRNPTIVLVADRVQLVTQMWDQFRTTSMPRIQAPDTAGEMRELLHSDRRGLVFSTVHKFANAGLLNERDNIVVMVDEAHRTQEGDLGQAMRAALPNATLVAFTGTPIANADHDTFAVFGDDQDTDKTLHTYGTDDSIRDGMTVPIHVAPRKVEFSLDREALDEAFDAMADEEELDEQQRDLLAKKASRTSTFFSNPHRVAAVCADLVDHFYTTVDPLGMKAQVVVVDRGACVTYHDELDRLLQARYDAQVAAAAEDPNAEAPVRDEVAVVMTVGQGKSDPADWNRFQLAPAQEEALLHRFRSAGDPLKFLVCTSKLGTGFNAPIEGVMYLDKPLKDHTLFQTITRANRTWRNKDTGDAKRYGLIVDYVGLGQGFARAMMPADPDGGRKVDIDGLLDVFVSQLDHTMLRFSGIDVATPGPQTLMDAQARMPNKAAEDTFAADFQMLEGIWESLAPHERLQPYRAQYRFLAQVYASIAPTTPAADLLWHRLGQKTLALVHEHMHDIAVTHASEVVVADAETVQQLLDEGLIGDRGEVEGKSADDIIDSIADRLKKKMTTNPADLHPVYKSLAERLDNLRERTLAAAQQSIDWLRDAFQLATDLTVAEEADAAGTLDLLPDPRVGALTQIFREFAPGDAPVMIERVVLDVDAIVKQVSYEGWADTNEGDRLVRKEVRAVLGRHQLHKVPGLFERAYEYISAHY